LVWNDRSALARDHALREAGRAPSTFWLARAGDAALLLRDLREARQLYERALALSPDEPWVELTLADVAHLEGDRGGERRLRERIYGSLQAR
jgi:tetratricopeptide (TPR) repeat protein